MFAPNDIDTLLKAKESAIWYGCLMRFLTESATVQNTVYGDKEAFKFGCNAAV